eukprot:TRINITY_DN2512_c0_g1_i1.p1 TRINITY_DN2512_c0_g1~~TRINITY_DN2512_c0_g1_i1.p1  ORF type:complete len:165 (-),score=35.82 TRINITY_DN2512_c0_g1_i1:72-566(-)
MDIPVLTLIDASETVKPAEVATPKIKRSDSMHFGNAMATALSDTDGAIEYFNRFHIPQIMNALLTQLLVQKPPKPVSFCIQFLRTADVLVTSGGGPPPSEQKQMQITEPASHGYIIKSKLPWLFDELLSNLLVEKPLDPHTYCLTWLRWNRAKYEGKSEAGADP